VIARQATVWLRVARFAAVHHAGAAISRAEIIEVISVNIAAAGTAAADRSQAAHSNLAKSSAAEGACTTLGELTIFCPSADWPERNLPGPANFPDHGRILIETSRRP